MGGCARDAANTMPPSISPAPASCARLAWPMSLRERVMFREVPSAAVRVALSVAALCAGCGTTVGVHAANMAPTNLPASFCNDTVSGALFVSSAMAINTDTDCGSVVTQPTGPDLCLIRYNAINITEFGSLTLSGSRPLVLTSQTSLFVTGAILAGAGANAG